LQLPLLQSVNSQLTSALLYPTISAAYYFAQYLPPMQYILFFIVAMKWAFLYLLHQTHTRAPEPIEHPTEPAEPSIKEGHTFCPFCLGEASGNLFVASLGDILIELFVPESLKVFVTRELRNLLITYMSYLTMSLRTKCIKLVHESLKDDVRHLKNLLKVYTNLNGTTHQKDFMTSACDMLRDNTLAQALMSIGLEPTNPEFWNRVRELPPPTDRGIDDKFQYVIPPGKTCFIPAPHRIHTENQWAAFINGWWKSNEFTNQVNEALRTNKWEPEETHVISTEAVTMLDPKKASTASLSAKFIYTEETPFKPFFRKAAIDNINDIPDVLPLLRRLAGDSNGYDVAVLKITVRHLLSTTVKWFLWTEGQTFVFEENCDRGEVFELHEHTHNCRKCIENIMSCFYGKRFSRPSYEMLSFLDRPVLTRLIITLNLTREECREIGRQWIARENISNAATNRPRTFCEPTPANFEGIVKEEQDEMKKNGHWWHNIFKKTTIDDMPSKLLAAGCDVAPEEVKVEVKENKKKHNDFLSGKDLLDAVRKAKAEATPSDDIAGPPDSKVNHTIAINAGFIAKTRQQCEKFDRIPTGHCLCCGETHKKTNVPERSCPSLVHCARCHKRHDDTTPCGICWLCSNRHSRAEKCHTCTDPDRCGTCRSYRRKLAFYSLANDKQWETQNPRFSSDHMAAAADEDYRQACQDDEEYEAAFGEFVENLVGDSHPHNMGPFTYEC